MGAEKPNRPTDLQFLPCHEDHRTDMHPVNVGSPTDIRNITHELFVVTQVTVALKTTQTI